MSSAPGRSLAIAPARNLQSAAWQTQLVAVALANLLLWASAKAQAPFWPVPITLQTYVVLVMGPLLGWRIAGATMLAYLAEGALGLPVFAGTPAKGIGLLYMAGPTGGYLLGYLAAVLIVGLLTQQAKWNRSLAGLAAALVIGELTILGLGSLWLAVLIGWRDAIAGGIGPFLVGDAVKLVLALATLSYWQRFDLDRP